ncbi:hypothetical protein CAPTEDRAFT_180697 [Capitella teleta]|uniref:Fucosyltransferase n=1 Tax=Capitella teleta TaxID=283909 RepID=R7TJC5_CAPTE|nr:hypothetical protein CAPTEDRAFT_180697 [Capitella teleta]|eukprot:ELT93602.1 hypothetical protein CAPTEDRAFT_180697 [Capitella teleta]
MRCHYITKPSALNFSSAVLLHSRFLDEITVPTTRKSGQKWIFFESEPPPETWKRANLTKYRDIFNITSTYSMDSDIPLTYHKSVCVPNLSYQVPTHNLAATKSKHVAWFVSSCSTHSRREEYVRELQKYIGVDIFGKCGDEKCYNVEDGESCIRDVINSTYKFYLSFENSLCREYHTEKLSRIFSLNTIPIVLGLADYANILPRGAYIDVRDYPSPKAMADYLHEIDQNDDLFNQYIIRKNSHWCHLPDSITFACSVCRYLHEHRYERKSVHDIARFWGNEERCMSPDLFYKGIADDVLVHL